MHLWVLRSHSLNALYHVLAKQAVVVGAEETAMDLGSVRTCTHGRVAMGPHIIQYHSRNLALNTVTFISVCNQPFIHPAIHRSI
eukprot:scaffold174337_cov31-Prasinocladus_malaysianus.AAC.1